MQVERSQVGDVSHYRLRRGAVVVAALTLFFGVGTGTANAEPKTLHLDERHGAYPLPGVVHEVEDACKTPNELTVVVRLPRARFASTIQCRAARADPGTAIAKPLVSKAARYSSAGAKADRVIAVQRAIPATPGLSYDHDQMVWSFAAQQPLQCERADSQDQIRQHMAEGAQSSGESPEHWTLLEAVMVAGACPDRLPHLIQNVSAIGQPDAAAAVEQLLRSSARPIPSPSTSTLASVCDLDGGESANEFRGLSLAQAKALAARRGRFIFVRGRDGVCYPSTQDRRPDRVDIDLSHGKVVAATVG